MNSKLKIRLFAFSLVVFSICCVEAQTNQIDRLDPLAVANSLAKKMTTRDSFQAEYQVLGATNSMGIVLLYDNSHQYLMMKMTSGDEAPAYIVYDIASLSGKDSSFKFAFIVEGKGSQVDVSFRDLVDRMDNAIGMFTFLSRQFSDASDTKATEKKTVVFAPNISLGLSLNSLSTGFSFNQSDDTDCQASWLSPSKVDRAIEVVELDESFRFTYPSNHVVWVDKTTGILRRDNYPNPKRPGPREIVLVDYGKLESPLPYSELIPDYDSIEFQPMLEQEQFVRQMSVAFLTELGRSLGEVDQYDQLLEKHAESIAEKARVAGRAYAREGAMPAFLDEMAENILTGLHGALDRFKGDCTPEQEDELFGALLKSVLSEAKTGEALGSFEDAFEKGGSAPLLKKYGTALEGLPADARVPLEKLFDVAIPAFCDGIIKEMIAITFERVGELHVEQQKKSSAIDQSKENNPKSD